MAEAMLVGSANVEDAEELFRLVAENSDGTMRQIPDWERGRRRNWLAAQGPLDLPHAEDAAESHATFRALQAAATTDAPLPRAGPRGGRPGGSAAPRRHGAPLRLGVRRRHGVRHAE